MVADKESDSAKDRSRSVSDVPHWLEQGAALSGRFLVVAAAMFVLGWVLKEISFVVSGLLLGIIEISALWPVVRWLTSRRVPTAVAAVAVVFLATSALLGLLVAAVWSLVNEAPQLLESVTKAVESIGQWLSESRLEIPDQLVAEIIGALQGAATSMLGALGSGVIGGVGFVAGLLSLALFATFVAIFGMADGGRLWHGLIDALPAHSRGPAVAAGQGVLQTIGAWLIASTLTGLVDGLFIGLGLWILGVPLVIPLAAMTFVLAYIPLVGATVAGLVAVLVAFADGGLVTALWTLAVVIFVQQVEGNVLSPLLLSRAVRFHPVITLALMSSAGIVFGVVGIFLAVPVSGAVVRGIRDYRAATEEAQPVSGDVPAEEHLPVLK